MSEYSSGVGETPENGTTWGLPNPCNISRIKKVYPQSRSLWIDFVNRTHDHKHEHYACKDVIAATQATEGSGHDE